MTAAEQLRAAAAKLREADEDFEIPPALIADLLDFAAKHRDAAERGAASVSDESYTLNPDQIDQLTPYALPVARAILESQPQSCGRKLATGSCPDHDPESEGE